MASAIAIAVVLVFLSISGLADSIISIITGEHKYCDDSPYDPNCVCPEGSRKIYVPWLGVPKWNCEVVEDLILDPNSPTFHEDSIKFVRNYFEKYCGSVCGDLSCGELCDPSNPVTCSGDKYMVAAWGYDNKGRRIVNVECRVVTDRYPDGSEKEGYNKWQMFFIVESPTKVPVVQSIFIHNNFCYNKELGKKCVHQSICEQFGNPEWCVGNLPLEII